MEKNGRHVYTETAEFKDPSLGQGVVKQSKNQVIKKYSELNEVFPDLKDQIVAIYPSGEQHIIVEFISTGTAPDNSKFELPICTIFTITNKTNAFYYPEKLFFTMKCKTERFYYKFILFQTKLFNYEIQKHQKFFFNDSCIFSYCCHGTT